MGVREILEEWTAWRMEGVRRRVCFAIRRKEEKLHLLKGLRRILLDIDRAIQIIRDTEEDAEVIPNLMIGFGIDQLQAEYVADIRLRNINKEYILKRTREVEELEAEIADLQETAGDPKRIRRRSGRSTPSPGAPRSSTSTGWRRSCSRRRRSPTTPSTCSCPGRGI